MALLRSCLGLPHFLSLFSTDLIMEVTQGHRQNCDLRQRDGILPFLVELGWCLLNVRNPLVFLPTFLSTIFCGRQWDFPGNELCLMLNPGLAMGGVSAWSFLRPLKAYAGPGYFSQPMKNVCRTAGAWGPSGPVSGLCVVWRSKEHAWPHEILDTKKRIFQNPCSRPATVTAEKHRLKAPRQQNRMQEHSGSTSMHICLRGLFKRWFPCLWGGEDNSSSTWFCC